MICSNDIQSTCHNHISSADTNICNYYVYFIKIHWLHYSPYVNIIHETSHNCPPFLINKLKINFVLDKYVLVGMI